MLTKKVFLSEVSPALKRDIEKITQQIGNSASDTSIFTLRGCRSGILKGITAWPEEHSGLLNNLKLEGISSLQNSKYWLKLEITATHNLENQTSLAFLRGLNFCFRLLYPGSHTCRPSSVDIFGTSVSLLRLYVLSEEVGAQLQRDIRQFISYSSLANATKKAIVQQVIQLVKVLIQDKKESLGDIYNRGLDNNSLSAMGVPRHRLAAVKSQLKTFIKAVEPRKFSRVKISITGLTLDVTELSTISALATTQVSELSQMPYYTGQYGHSSKGIRARLSCAIRTIINYCKTNELFQKQFTTSGFDALSINDYQPLKNIFGLYSTYEATAVTHLYEQLTGSSVNQRVLFCDILHFTDEKTGKKSTIDVTPLKALCPKLVDDIKFIHKQEIYFLGQKNYGAETLRTRIAKLVTVFTSFCKTDDVRGPGVQCLSMERGKLQIKILSNIQQKVFNQTISRRTAEGYVSAIRWLCDVTNQKFINAYRIANNRHSAHARRLSTRDTYSLDEVRELAFYVEKGIEINEYSLQDKLAFYFARIQLKTCWNTSSLATIEHTDIRDMDLHSSSGPVTVLVQKPRKGYQTDAYNFDYKVTKSAIHDLLKVRDELTYSIRSKHKSDKFSGLLFIYEENGKLKVISANGIVARIATLLNKLGCSIKYNSTKLRKTGANEIYRQISRDFRRYKDVFKHSYSTFLKHYQRINETSSKTTLDDATKVMGQYFLNKEISSDIQIVTEYDSSTQLTPLGGCGSQTGSSDALTLTDTENTVNSENKESCGDFLACVWCKYYRVVADAEHVWQLLSFKEFILSDMQGTIAHFPDGSIQKDAQKALSMRVSTIIAELRKINPKQVTEGVNLFEKNGLHPIWNYTLVNQEQAK